MSTAVEEILHASRRLTQEEQRLVVAAILRGRDDLEHPRLDDEALALIADETFRQYDAREAAEHEA